MMKENVWFLIRYNNNHNYYPHVCFMSQKSMQNLPLHSKTETFLLFSLHDELFAVPVEQVHYILCLKNIIPIPDAPFYVHGVINHRGKVVPISDLRTMLRFPQLSYNPRTVVIILEEEGIRNGIVVDKVMEVININVSEIEEAPKWKEKEERIFHRIAHHNDKACLILELHHILQDIPSLLKKEHES